MAVKLEKRTVIGIKSETTQNTAITLTPPDFIRAEDVTIEPVPENLVRNYYRSSIGPMVTVPGRMYYKIGLKTELKGGGAAGTPYAPLGAIFKAGGWLETINASTNVIYAPTSVPTSANFFGAGIPATIEVFMDGVKHRAIGTMGKWKITFPGGKLPMVEFEGFGMYETPSDVAFPTQSYLSVNAVKVESLNVSLQSFSVIASQIEIDSGSEYVLRDDVRSADSIGGFLITGRKPTAKIDPEHELIASQAFINKLRVGTAGSFSFALIGGGGNIVSIVAPNAQYQGVKYGSRNGIRTVEAELLLAESSGDDELTITFT